MEGCVMCQQIDFTKNGFYICDYCSALACPEEFTQPDLSLEEQLEFQLEKNLFQSIPIPDHHPPEEQTKYSPLLQMKLDLLRLCQTPCGWEHKCRLFLLVEEVFLYTDVSSGYIDTCYQLIRTSLNDGSFNWKLYHQIEKRVKQCEKIYRCTFKKQIF